MSAKSLQFEKSKTTQYLKTSKKNLKKKSRKKSQKKKSRKKDLKRNLKVQPCKVWRSEPKEERSTNGPSPSVQLRGHPGGIFCRSYRNWSLVDTESSRSSAWPSQYWDLWVSLYANEAKALAQHSRNRVFSAAKLTPTSMADFFGFQMFLEILDFLFKFNYWTFSYQ